MKSIMFFVCMIICGLSLSEANAEALAEVVCTDGSIKHTYSADSDDRNILYIDGEVYTYQYTNNLTDMDLTKYTKENDSNSLAYISVEYLEDDHELVKLVLMKDGSNSTEFGGICELP